ncbi:MAG: helix-turn-helix transcriptional regulator [Gammaproteobacteria bacterium]|nr:helix-turn-helix transcriptional regulator [Gammaproteobacteria bacterium]
MRQTELQAAFGRILRQLRVQKGLSQEALADAAELDRTYISLLERGQRQPSLTTLFALSAVLNAKPSDLIKRLEKS